jgi:hypothetical protein
MRKYLLPAVVCAALGALILLLAKRGETTPGSTGRTEAETPAPPPPQESPLGTPAETRTRLDEHKALREMQRALKEGSKNALYYRQQVCEDIAAIAASEKLSKDLLDTIREYMDSDDPALRDVVIPILRIFENPEATKLIAEKYYRTADEAEQITLLEAMSKPFHDPKTASVWGLDKALNSPSFEHRERAYDILKTYVNDHELLIDASIQLYSASLDERQRQIALRVIGERGDVSATARLFMRRVLRNPQGMADIATLMAGLSTWGDEDDAARLDQLADEFPAMGQPLRDTASSIRRARAEQRNPESPKFDEPEKRRKEDLERAAEEERRKAEQSR